MNTVSRIGLFVARLALAAWLGAAILFVMVGVREVTSPDFSNEVKDRLAVLRFPLYYATGFTLVGISLAGLLVSRSTPELSSRWRRTAIVLLLLSLGGMAADHRGIYQPLVKVVTPPGQTRTSEFTRLHKLSARVNSLNLAVCLIAAVIIHWPGRNEIDSV